MWNWYYTDSEATTDIPNEATVSNLEGFDLETGDFVSSRIIGSSTAAVFSFSELEDEVESYGWSGRANNP